MDLPPSLTPLQQMLLRTDGTLTPILEACASEPVEVVKLHQEFDVCGQADPRLELPAEAKVLRRRVVLRGALTKTPLLYAEAVVVPDRVDSCLVEDLLRTDKPIGTLLAEYRVETLRDILAVGLSAAGDCGPSLAASPAAPVVSRTYRIVAHREPIMLITESFRADAFLRLPA